MFIVLKDWFRVLNSRDFDGGTIEAMDGKFSSEFFKWEIIIEVLIVVKEALDSPLVVPFSISVGIVLQELEFAFVD